MADALLENQWKRILKSHADVTDDGLGEALRAFAKLSAGDAEERREALDEIVSCAEKAKKQHLRNKEVVGYLNDVLEEADERLKKLDEEDEADGQLLSDEGAYGKYLRKQLLRVVKKPQNFAAGVGRAVTDHRVLFHTSKDGKKLVSTLKDQTELKKFAWGLAAASPDEQTTLTLALDSNPVGGLKKKFEQLLKYFKPLPFDTVVLMVDGEIVPDLPDPDDPDSAESRSPQAAKLEMALQALSPLVTTVSAAQPNRAGELQSEVEKIRELIRDEQYVQAQTDLLALGKLLKSLAGGTTSSNEPSGDSEADRCRQAKNRIYPSVKEALAAAPDRKSDLLQLLSAADKDEKAGNFATAIQRYEELGTLAQEILQTSAKTTEESPTESPLNNVSNVVFQQIRLSWEAARKRLQDELTIVISAVKKAVEEHNANPDVEEIIDADELKKGLEKMQSVTEKLDLRLIDKLDEALNATDPATRQKKHREAKGIVNEYLDFIGTDQVMAKIDENGFAVTKVKKVVEGALKTMAGKL